MIDFDQMEQFWSAVQECLSRFHQLDASAAAQRVQAARARLPRLPSTANVADDDAISDPTLLPSFEDMIYHAEPWYVAAVIVGSDRLSPNENEAAAYRELLVQHRLAPPQ